MPSCHATSVCLVAAALVTAASLPGCSRRTIEVTSTPPGAVVWLNDQQVGRTPIEVHFTHFGVYDVRLKLDGYEPISTSRHAVTPVHEYPPIDLPASALPIEHRVTWHFDLTPTPDQPPSALVARAAALRARAATEALPAPARPPADPAPAATPAAPPAAPASGSGTSAPPEKSV